jgi:hypothetical protein
MSDGTGIARYPPQHRVTVVGIEKFGHGRAFLRDQPVHPSSDGQVQRVAGVEQAQVRGADRRSHGVGDAGPADATQDGDVAQAAGRLLEVALEQKRQLAVTGPAGRGDLLELREQAYRGAPPLVADSGDQLGREGGVAGDVPRVEQAQRDLDVVVRDRERLGQRPDRVVQAHLGVPDRIPQRGRDPVDPGRPVVQQHQVQVAVRRTVPPAEPADRDQADPGQMAGEHRGQPRVERRRPFRTGGGADVHAKFVE